MRISRKAKEKRRALAREKGLKYCAYKDHVGPNPLEVHAFHRNKNDSTGRQPYCAMCNRKRKQGR